MIFILSFLMDVTIDTIESDDFHNSAMSVTVSFIYHLLINETKLPRGSHHHYPPCNVWHKGGRSLVRSWLGPAGLNSEIYLVCLSRLFLLCTIEVSASPLSFV